MTTTSHRNVQRFRGGLVLKAHRPCVSLNSRLESNTEEEEEGLHTHGCTGVGCRRSTPTLERAVEECKERGLLLERNGARGGRTGSEAGSYFRLIDLVYHSTLGLRVIRKKKKSCTRMGCRRATPTLERAIYIYIYR